MNRRNFLSLLGMTAGGLALEKVVPFNRVWSFPKNIVIASPINSFDYSANLKMAMRYATQLSAELNREWERDFAFIAGENWDNQPFLTMQAHLKPN